MHINELRIVNYKRFKDSGAISLGPGFNFIVGENDVGKSALVQFLGPDTEHIPHRTSATMPDRTFPIDPLSRLTVTANVMSTEVAEILTRRTDFSAPFTGNDQSGAMNRLNKAARIDSLLRVEMYPGRQRAIPSLSVFGEGPFDRHLRVHNPKAPHSLEMTENGVSLGHSGNEVPVLLYDELIRRTFAIRAERLNIGLSVTGRSAHLQPNASNLAEVLYNLQANPARMDRYRHDVRTVFPHITTITARPHDGNAVQVLVWHENTAEEREDLAVPLAQSGTGVSQVLAILYVVVTANEPQILIIDEPNSFLHPGALRKLFQLLQAKYPQHQYVITANSPAGLLTTNPTTIHLLRRHGLESKAHPVDARSMSDLNQFLEAVDARLSDVFGPDRILWVEGKTEEMCIPIVLSHFFPDLLSGISVLGVTSTSDLASKDGAKIFEIYNRLVTAPSLLPRDSVFVFDQENRSQSEQQAVRSWSGGRIHFLDRRMFENYLLVPAALSAVLTREDTGHIHAAETIITWIGTHSSRFLPRGVVAPPFSAEWLQKLDGACLISELFTELSDGRLEFRKVHHCQLLTKAVLELDNQGLKSLAEITFRPLLVRPSVA